VKEGQDIQESREETKSESKLTSESVSELNNRSENARRCSGCKSRRTEHICFKEFASLMFAGGEEKIILSQKINEKLHVDCSVGLNLFKSSSDLMKEKCCFSSKSLNEPHCGVGVFVKGKHDDVGAEQADMTGVSLVAIVDKTAN
jgi:hypothetical protein